MSDLIAAGGGWRYTGEVKGSRRISVILVNTMLVFCALFLIAALSTGGMAVLAILSVVISLAALIFVSFRPRTPALLSLRAAHRRFSSRSPPRF